MVIKMSRGGGPPHCTPPHLGLAHRIYISHAAYPIEPVEHASSCRIYLLCISQASLWVVPTYMRIITQVAWPRTVSLS